MIEPQMTFDEAMQTIAHRAADASSTAMSKLGAGKVKHEDDLTGVLVQAIEERVNGTRFGGLSWNVTWDYSILTHRKSGEEGKYGADLLIHVSLDTPQYKYSKGVLVQAKRIGPGQNMSTRDYDDLKAQCSKMSNYTPASFVFAFDPHGLRAGAATKIAGAADRALYDQCNWTAYRFFLELFRCPIGDVRITSAAVPDLEPRITLAIAGTGALAPDRLRDVEQ
jgi:hypothetical protein